MKKVLSLILAAAITLSMVSCNESRADNQSDVETEIESSSVVSKNSVSDKSSSAADLSSAASSKTDKVSSSSSTSDKKRIVSNMKFKLGSEQGTYSGEVVDDRPQGYGQFCVSDDHYYTCGSWQRGRLSGSVTEYIKNGNTITYNDSKYNALGKPNGNIESVELSYTDSSCKTLESIFFGSSQISNSKLNGDTVCCLITNDGIICFMSGQTVDGDMKGTWNYTIIDGEKIIDEGTVSETKSKSGILGAIGKVLGGIKNVGKKALSTIKNTIGSVVNKIKGLSPEQKKKATNIAKYLAGELGDSVVDSLTKDKEAEQKYKLEHPYRSAAKELYDGLRFFTGLADAAE